MMLDAVGKGRAHWTRLVSGMAGRKAGRIPKLMGSLFLLLGVPLAAAQTASTGYQWTGGTCCGQNQPQFIHNPQALVNYFVSTPLPAGSPYARTFPSYTTCTAPPTALGQSCIVYAWYTNIPYTSSEACPVADLTQLTDPVAVDFDTQPGNRWRPDGLTPDFQGKLQCVESHITAAGGTYVGTSAYRPTQYQQHLYEIVEKDRQLNPAYMSYHPECQDVRDAVTLEMGPSPGHALHPGQKVAVPGNSRHEQRIAFDLTPNGLTNAQLAPIYPACGVTHAAVSGEPWHVQ